MCSKSQISLTQILNLVGKLDYSLGDDGIEDLIESYPSYYKDNTHD